MTRSVSPFEVVGFALPDFKPETVLLDPNANNSISWISKILPLLLWLYVYYLIVT